MYKTYYDVTIDELVAKEQVVDYCKYAPPYDQSNIESCLFIVGTPWELNPSQQRNTNIKVTHYMTHEHHNEDSN